MIKLMYIIFWILLVTIALCLIGLIIYRYFSINNDKNFFINNWMLFLLLLFVVMASFVLLVIKTYISPRKSGKIFHRTPSSTGATYTSTDRESLNSTPELTEKSIPLLADMLKEKINPGSIPSNEIRPRCPPKDSLLRIKKST